MSEADFIKYIRGPSTVIFSGGFGTTLNLHGFDPQLPLWSAAANLTHSRLVEQVHDEFREAGAHVLSTNTFRTAPATFAKAQAHFEATPNSENPLSAIVLRDYTKAAQRATVSALEAVVDSASKHRGRQPLFVAGSYGPIHDTHSAPAVLPDSRETKVLLENHRHQATLLAGYGVDFILPETASIRAEAETMARAASETNKSFILSLVLDPKRGTLYDGTTIEEAVRITDKPGRIGVTINCTPAHVIGSALDELLKHTKGFVGAYANGGGGPAADRAGWEHDLSPAAIGSFVDTALGWREKDPRVKILGGCCGAAPAYIGALSEAVARETAADKVRSTGMAVNASWAQIPARAITL